MSYFNIKETPSSESKQCVVATNILFSNKLIDENEKQESDTYKHVESVQQDQKVLGCLPNVNIIERHLESEEDISDNNWACKLKATYDGKPRTTCYGKDNRTSPLPNNSSCKPTSMCHTVHLRNDDVTDHEKANYALHKHTEKDDFCHGNDNDCFGNENFEMNCQKLIEMDSDKENSEIYLANEHTETNMAFEYCETDLPYEHSENNLAKEHTKTNLAKEYSETYMTKEHTEINLSNERTETNVAKEHSESNFAKEPSETNFTKENTETYLAYEHTETNSAKELTETDWLNEDPETNWLNEDIETNWLNEDTETVWVNEHHEITFACEHSKTNLAYEHTETNLAYEHNESNMAKVHIETNLAKEHTETKLAYEDSDIDLAIKYTNIDFGNEKTENHLANEVINEHTKIGLANVHIETYSANKHTEVNSTGNKAIETDHLVVVNECKVAHYSDNKASTTEITTARSTLNELTESEELCEEPSKTRHSIDSQSETSNDVNVDAEGLWEQSLISDFQSIRNDLAQYETLDKTSIDRWQIKVNSSSMKTSSTKRTKISDSKSNHDPGETFHRPYSSTSTWKPSVTSTDESNIKSSVISTDDSNIKPSVTSTDDSDIKPSVTSTDDSNIISQLKIIRNELLHIGRVDVLDHEDLGLQALFQEQSMRTKVNAKSKSSKKRKKRLQKLVNPPKNCSSGLRHKRFATSFEELHRSALFLDIDVDTKFTCSVCLELYYIPTACRPCGHIFCDPCLRRLTAQGAENVPCPLCRSIIARCDVDTELDAHLMMNYPEIYSHRATQEQISKYRHYKLPLTIPVPLGRRIIRQMIGSRNNQSDWSWMSHDWVKLVLGCTAGLCLALLILVLYRVRTVKDLMDVSKERSHGGDRTRDLPVARRTPYPLHHGDRFAE
ncbi:hypothetical protein DPMN_177193 [Dreissena polymorpha]|uniref:RING-type domain-containing protein n=1 Tax=Dreissena polymorpha TaxID=45954 RepID=A0A9D4ECJ7_DREPO|nr:hypothetical protein DPMN_177193 [Dreissena polymorpha]